MAGLAEGIDTYEASFAGLGGCPFAAGATGNICTEDLVYMLHEMGIETGIDLDRLCAAARHVEQVIGRTPAGPGDEGRARGSSCTRSTRSRPRSAEPCRSPASGWST